MSCWKPRPGHRCTVQSYELTPIRAGTAPYPFRNHSTGGIGASDLIAGDSDREVSRLEGPTIFQLSQTPLHGNGILTNRGVGWLDTYGVRGTYASPMECLGMS